MGARVIKGGLGMHRAWTCTCCACTVVCLVVACGLQFFQKGIEIKTIIHTACKELIRIACTLRCTKPCR